MRPPRLSIVALFLFLSWITPLVGVTLCCRWDSPESSEAPTATVSQSVCEHEAPASSTADAPRTEGNHDHVCCQNVCAGVFSSTQRHESPILSPANLICQTAVFTSAQSVVFLSQFTESCPSTTAVQPSPSNSLPLYLLNVSYRI